MLATQSPQSSPARTPIAAAPVDVTPLFPRGVYEDIDNCAEVIAAQDDLEQRRRAGAPTGACVIIEDEQLQDQACVELSGPGASLNFRSRSCVQPYIVLYVKVSTKFFALRLNVIDRNEKYYTFNLSNRRSIVKVDGCTCDLPLVVGEGWQYVAVPLAELTRRCFGADYYACVQVRVHASCRLFKLYAAARAYADVELPPPLRLLVADDDEATVNDA